MAATNILLDGFPTEYKGYPLNTGFRVGILISLLLKDKEVDEKLKILQAINLLYSDDVPPDPQEAIDGVFWFLSCGRAGLIYKDGYREEKPDEECLDFDFDQLDIWGAFWAKGIDLTKTDMHWFQFMSAIGNLGDCPLTTKMGYRATSLKDMKGETRKYYKELKEKYKIRETTTKQEIVDMIEEDEKINGKYHAKLLRAQYEHIL